MLASLYIWRKTELMTTAAQFHLFKRKYIQYCSTFPVLIEGAHHHQWCQHLRCR